ncbi:hypothetical protein [Bdellovibrio reynosensis]|uniref:Lipoprotein n=1 Tax=Bdellovibrio reynosensis TaxID=2835041 RepID=A0ABY4C5K1_9BACT|nr:hypothetical protein [Bdellovibrio reynosensis]UOF00165.1 hypothetical protein MNR06_10675 [Bdellovibrio reynosensis]
MKTVLKVLFSLIICCSLLACGLHEALEGTKQVPGKMDQTNGNMKKMLEEMKTTNKGVHDQSLLLPLENLIKEENHDTLAPVPFKLMPFGKKFAESATAEELIELTYLWLKEVDEALPAKDIDEATGDEVPYTKKQVHKINTQKIAKLTALQVIAGFAPQETVQEIINNYIVANNREGGRRFEETGYAFLMLRTVFIRDVLLKESIMATSIDNIGKLEEAMKYIKKLDAIARLRFTDKIRFKSRGLIDFEGRQLSADMQPSEKFDRKVAADFWASIYEKAQSQMRFDERSVGGNQSEDKALIDNEKKRLQYDLQIIEQALHYWKAQNLLLIQF